VSRGVRQGKCRRSCAAADVTDIYVIGRASSAVSASIERTDGERTTRAHHSELYWLWRYVMGPQSCRAARQLGTDANPWPRPCYQTQCHCFIVIGNKCLSNLIQMLHVLLRIMKFVVG